MPRFNSIHLALPVKDLERGIRFFKVLFGCEVIALDKSRRTSIVSYDRFEFSLYEMPTFLPWTRGTLGPFHIGHEVTKKSSVDDLYELACREGYETLGKPFHRDDGDYALFIKDDLGIMFEFFHGGHAEAVSRFRRAK